MYLMYMYAFTTKNQVSESLLRGDHSRLFSLSKCELHLNESVGGGGQGVCPSLLTTHRLRVVPLFFLRDSRASETRAHVKITPCEKRQHAREGLQTKPKLLNLCVALTMQNSDWFFHGNLSTSVKNAPATINTRHN